MRPRWSELPHRRLVHVTFRGFDPAEPGTAPLMANPDLQQGDEAAPPGADGRTDTVDQRFRSLMEGLRTTLPGAQVLVAFLLVLPVQAEFATLTTDELAAYYLAFMTALLSQVLLIAPSAHQRLRSPISGVARRTEKHLAIAVRVTIVGTGLLVIALAAVCYLVSSLVVNAIVAAFATALLLIVAGYTWAFQPLVVFRREEPAD